MTNTSKTIVFFGNERLGTGVTTTNPVLKRLINDGYNVAAIVVNNEKSQSRKTRKLEVAEIAQEHHIPLLQPKKLSDIKELLQSFKAEAAVLVAYGKIVPQSVIDIFPRGIINIHPSLLPLHRGPTPLESVILSGETETGVSLMRLAKAMDAGPVFAQQKVRLTGSEEKQQLADTLLTLGSDMLALHLPAIIGGQVEPVSQQEDKATYDALIGKEDGIINWDKPAQQIEREIRAYALWPKSKTTFGSIEVTILKAQVMNGKQTPKTRAIINKFPVVYCGDGQGLLLEILQPAGKKVMTGESFLAGYKKQFLEN